MKSVLALLFLLPLASNLRAADAPPARPNIVFIFSDDHSLQTIGAYDRRLSAFCREHQVTPNIDRLAAQGALFQNSFCGNSLCSPSRATILTGLHSHANGVMQLNQPIRAGLWTFPRALTEAGYQSAVFGKWHLAGTRPETQTWKLFPGQGLYMNPRVETPTGMETLQGHASDVVTEMSLDWLKKRDAGKPFLLMVNHKAPHRNWVFPPRHAKFLDGVTLPEPETLFDGYANRASPARDQKMSIDKDMTLKSDLKVEPEGTRIPPNSPWRARNEEFHAKKLEGQDLVRWKYQQYLKDYLRCVKSVDESVGKVMDYLKAEGLEENTVVIYSSDQGFYMGEHGWYDKRWIYEESIHMPLVIRWPAVVKPGLRPTATVQNIDYAPTLAAIAGAKAPDGLHGRSFLPILQTGETPADWRKTVYYHYYAPDSHNVARHVGVRTDRYTLAHFYTTNEWELFDRQSDPQQMKSVHADPAHAAALAETKAELNRLATLYADKTATPEFNPNPRRPAN